MTAASSTEKLLIMLALVIPGGLAFAGIVLICRNLFCNSAWLRKRRLSARLDRLLR